MDFWGKTGHRATGEIAEKHLTKKAKKKIHALLNGESLAMVSTYADEIKSYKEYWPYSPWHYVNFPFDSNYDEHPKSEKGDIYQAILKCVEVLNNDTSSKEDKVFHLKLLVHFMGDLHQPLHIGMAKDKGGNDFQVQWFGKGTNLHRVWDEHMIDEYEMSFSELADEAKPLSKAQKKAITSGSLKDWMYESREFTKDIYENTEVGEDLKYSYMARYMPLVRSQIQKGGLRLAHLLNEIFD